MIYLLWTLLSLIISIYFIVICLWAVKLVKEKYGWVVTIIFVLGLFSIIAKSPKTNGTAGNPTRKMKLLKSEADQERYSSRPAKEILIDKMGLSNFDIFIVYDSFKDSATLLPYEAYSTISGLVGGHEWDPDIYVSPTSKAGHFKYTVDGILKWQLLGLPLYLQPKHYTGFFDIQ